MSEMCPCPKCGAINRVPAGRLADGPACGRCSMRLFEGQPLQLDEAGFRLHRDRGSLPLLVDFWAQWCGPCLAMAPAFEAVARQLEPHVRVAKLDIDAAPAVASVLRIQSVPTMILFRGGHERDRISGAMPAPQIRAFVEAAMRKGAP